jgi:DNA-binding transcriptional regulator WhiA
MSDELKYTASLRCENDSATLSELAVLHEPPISKSGLNRRLEKIVAFAYEV